MGREREGAWERKQRGKTGGGSWREQLSVHTEPWLAKPSVSVWLLTVPFPTDGHTLVSRNRYSSHEFPLKTD
jgi:hypothetical protein